MINNYMRKILIDHYNEPLSTRTERLLRPDPAPRARRGRKRQGMSQLTRDGHTAARGS